MLHKHCTQLPSSVDLQSGLSCAQGPLVALAFKLEEGRFGQLTYMRIYSGTVRKGDPIVNATTGKRIKVCLLPAFLGPSCPTEKTF